MVHRLSAVRKQEDLLFVCQSPGAMATRSWLHSSVTAQVLLQSKAAGQLSIGGRGFFGSGFYEVHSEVCVCVSVFVSTSLGVTTPGCVGPCACLLLHCFPAEQQVWDLLTRPFVGRVSVVATVTTSCLPPPLPTGLVFDWPRLPRRRHSKGLWDEERAPL